LSIIQSCYSPAVQASVPVLSSNENLMKSNAVINQVQSLSSLLGPVIGGILFGLWGLTPIIIIGAASFFISAVMELFIHIPSVKQEKESNVFTLIKNDAQESFAFILHQNPVIFKILLVVCAFNLFISSLMVVGIPTIITINLALSSQLYGISQGFMAAGALLGGLMTGLLSNKLTVDKAHLILAGSALSVVPIALVLILPLPAMVCYVVITLFSMILMALASIFSIMMLSYLQMMTPNELIGKVMSVVIALSVCSQPIGQTMYGFLFSSFSAQPYIVILGAVIITFLITLLSRPLFKDLSLDMDFN
ncbi:MAG: MFS transporter, partial [Eubacterium sp.]